MIKKVGVFIAGFMVGIIVLYTWGQIFNKDADIDMILAGEDDINIITASDVIIQDKEMVDTTETQIQNEMIVVANQSAGNSVIVNSVKLDTGSSGGWVVVHEVNNGVMANALGAVRRDPGIHSNIEVKLLRATLPGGTYAVVLYSDNNDRIFNMATDTPLKNGEDYIMSTFQAN